jgi:hypothetical protein
VKCEGLGHSALLVAAAALALLAPGCSAESTREGGPGPIAFTPEAPAGGASIALRGRFDLLGPSRIAVDVVARGAADLHGAAFRMTWDPEALTFVGASSGAAWSKTALSLAKEGSPGALAVAWAEMGEAAIDATNETVLGTLSFELKGRRGTPLTFQKERSQLVDKKGAGIRARWLNDALTAR